MPKLGILSDLEAFFLNFQGKVT